VRFCNFLHLDVSLDRAETCHLNFANGFLVRPLKEFCMRRSQIPALILSLSLATLTAVPAASAQSTYKVIHDFTGPDGIAPTGGLTFDASGHLYGVAADGGNTTGSCGTGGCGTVFKLSRTTAGVWTKSAVYELAGGKNGSYPLTGLLADASGNLYGATDWGGVDNNGVVFELSPTSTGGWKYTILHTFQGSDGGLPEGKLIFDTAGNLYGVAQSASTNYGVVFELTPSSTGAWSETVLYTFTGGTDGAFPQGGLVFDTAGNLYGAAEGGASNYGFIFELSPTAAGWTETVLHTFTGPDGNDPSSGLVFDPSGNLYGTTQLGGASTACLQGCGVVFELSPTAAGWTETVLHSFSGPDGSDPYPGLARDSSGNLFGTANKGGNMTLCSRAGCGVVFELSNSTGSWTETLLHSFRDSNDGASPNGALILDESGNLYGTAASGGNLADCHNQGCGVAFEITR
jgi:uncharacterized repeat protein (TIGR03803 family)